MTTTLAQFWWDLASTTDNFITGNWSFFAMVFITALVIMLLGGLIMTMTRFWKKNR